jgi:uncharacterized RDD family membrane protein YckC
MEDNTSARPESSNLSEIELPQWRRELSVRLQKIKEKREGGPRLEAENSQSQARPLPFRKQARLPVVAEPAQEPEPIALPRARVAAKRARVALGSTETLLEPKPKRVQQRAIKRAPSFPLFEERERELIREVRDLPFPKQEIATNGPAPSEIESIIDRAVVRQAVQPDYPPADGERLILLSRTLSGMVDLVLVFLFTSICILAADSVSGVEILDMAGATNFALLLLAVFFVYSIFFLNTANQTIGMMITNLRLTGAGNERPTTRQVVIRSAVFLVSLLGLGIGLIIGCFDKRSACLHDRLSDTRVVRLPSLHTF